VCLFSYRLKNHFVMMESKALMEVLKSVVHHLVGSVEVADVAHSLEGRVYVALELL